ncbi:MAG: MFS transporter, partial [Anaerolineae bacterium]
RIHHRPPLIILAIGTAIFGVGFLMYGFVTSFVMFMVAMALVTVGEMFITPIGQALVAQFSPEDMRGRYMALFGFSWSVPSAVGPLLAGVIMDNADPRWVWYLAGLVGLAAAAAFAGLQRRSRRAARATLPETPLNV